MSGLKISVIQMGPIQTNCYFLLDEERNCLVVYYNDNMYHWAPFADSIQSFLLGIILEVFEEETDAGTHSTINPEYIQKVLDEAGVDFQRLQEPYPFQGGYFAHTCLDTDTNTLYVYGEERENRPPCLKIFKHEER